MRKQFFENGTLSSTSANHVANMAKEYYCDIETHLSGIQFYNETISIIGEQNSHCISKGYTSLLGIREMLKEIEDCKSLIAWLREGIKEKQFIYEKALHYQDEEKEKELELLNPDDPVYLTESEIVSSWSIGKQEKYLSLETKCAVLGEFIHPKGALNKAKEKLAEYLTHPQKVDRNGRDTIITSFEPTMSMDDVKSVFFSLQDEYRSAQAELNGLKNEIKIALDTDKAQKDSEYRKLYTGYCLAMKEYQNELKVKRNELAEEANNLKIVIPNNLKEIYSKINSLSK